MKGLIGKLGLKGVISEYLFTLIIVFIVGAILIKVILTIERRMLKKSVLDDAGHVAIIRVSKIILWVLLVLTLITKAGIDPSPYIAVLATCGAAVALALKDSLSNVAGGMILLFTKPFVKGDEIQVDNVSGIVDYIDIMTTRLHTFSNSVITVPNSKMVNSVLVNKTLNDIIRVDLKFTVSYDSDLEKVRVLLNNVVKESDILLDDPKPIIGVTSHEESGIKWDMLVWTHTDDRFNAKYYLEEKVKEVFDENQISIPFPHVDVTIEGRDGDK